MNMQSIPEGNKLLYFTWEFKFDITCLLGATIRVWTADIRVDSTCKIRGE